MHASLLASLWPRGRVYEGGGGAFKPGFTGERTEMKSLACPKRRKLRKLRERYGEIVVCLGRAELAALRAKYGRRA
jgi:hypothetical protein